MCNIDCVIIVIYEEYHSEVMCTTQRAFSHIEERFFVHHLEGVLSLVEKRVLLYIQINPSLCGGEDIAMLRKEA